MKRYIRPKVLEQLEIEAMYLCSTSARGAIAASIASNKLAIFAGISSKDITKSMVRVKSSNVWSYTINIRNRGDKVGDVYVQFKGDRGGPGDVYVLYDVPVNVYRKWVSAPSKGHFYWQYLRNNYKYSKLTGDKRGKLPNAVNY